MVRRLVRMIDNLSCPIDGYYIHQVGTMNGAQPFQHQELLHSRNVTLVKQDRARNGRHSFQPYRIEPNG